MLPQEVGSDHSEGGPHYLVNIEALDTVLRRLTIHRLAVDRFGAASGRIVELMQRYKHLEQQTISDLIILPPREARERLYKLYL